MALFLFALGILSITAARMTGFAGLAGPEPAPPQLAWREGTLAPALSRGETSSPAGEKQPLAGRAPAQKTQAAEKLPARLAPLFFKPIPINQADAEILTTIPGIGPVFARRIIEFRGQHGRINAIEELDAVKGVGPAKLKILKDHLVID